MPVNPLLGIKAVRPSAGNPLLDIPSPQLEPRPFNLGEAFRSGVQNIGRIGMAPFAAGEQIASSLMNVPEGFTPFSDTLKNMALTDANNQRMAAEGYTDPSLLTQAGEGAIRSVIGMAPGLALGPVAAMGGAGPLAVNATVAAPGFWDAVGNSLGNDLNDPSMTPFQRLYRAAGQGGIEFGTELVPMSKLGMGGEDLLARAMANSGVSAPVKDLVSAIPAQAGQEALAGATGSVFDDLTNNTEETFTDVMSQAGSEAGMGALTSLPVTTAISGATGGAQALRDRQMQQHMRQQEFARLMQSSFDPNNAQALQQPTADLPPLRVTPEVIREAQANPGVPAFLVADAVSKQRSLDEQQQLSPEEMAQVGAIAAAMTQADDTVVGQRELREADDVALREQLLREQIDNAIGKPGELPEISPVESASPDAEQVAVEKLLADQERVTNEREQRQKRRDAYLVREDLRSAESGVDVGSHRYGDDGKLTVDSNRPNRFLALPPERRTKAVEKARKFVQINLGDDQGEFAGDDPTASPAVAKYRMEQKPLPESIASGVRTSVPPAMPTAADIVAMPAQERMATFRALPADERVRIQPEITRLIQEQKKQTSWQSGIRGFNDAAPVTEPALTQGSAPRETANRRTETQGELNRSNQPSRPGELLSTLPEMNADPTAQAVMAKIGSRGIDHQPTKDDERDVAVADGANPTFQGGKNKMRKSVVAAVRTTFGKDAERITEIHDLFGSGGGWGLTLALARFPNANTLTIREFDPERLGKIKLLHERGDQFRQIAKSSGAEAFLQRVYSGVESAGGLSGRIKANQAELSAMSEDARAVVAAIGDYGNASFGRRSFDGIMEMVAGQAGKVKSVVDKYQQRGGTIHYTTGSSFDQSVPSGPHVLAVADPPYYGTSAYNPGERKKGGGDKVSIDIYRQVGALLERLNQQKNSVIYTDEAWWAKKSKKGDQVQVPDDWRQAVPVLDGITQSLDRYDWIRKRIAGRHEVLGVTNGFQSRSASQPSVPGRTGADPASQGRADSGVVDTGRGASDQQSAKKRLATVVDGQVGSDPGRAGRDERSGPVAEPKAEPAKTEPAAPAAVVPSPSQPSKEISRLTGIARAVLPSGVKVEPRGDHIAITYPGGASILMRSVESVPLDPAAWYDSVAKSKGALSAAFSRAGLGALSPSKAGWMKLPKAKQQAVMAELLPIAMISDVSGRRVGLSLQAVASLIQPAKQSDATVADAIEEEEHHFTFSALLSDAERKVVRDDLAQRSPELLKEDPASRAVMEAAYGHWRAWRVNAQKAAVTPRVSGIFNRLLQRIKALLPFLNKVPHVDQQTAASVWEQLDAVRNRTAATPGETTDEGAANAVIVPKGDSLRGEDLRKQWSKATGERMPTAKKSWQELKRDSDAKDREEGREVAYAIPQALNDIMPSDQAQTFQQWQDEATTILADENRIADVRQRAQADAGLSPAEQVAIRRLVSEQYAEAVTSGNRNRYQEALETASMRKASGARAARELAARRMDLSTADGRRELLISYTTEMGERWQTAYKKAKGKRDKAAVADRWQKQQERIRDNIKKKYDIDLADPRLGEIFADSYSLGRLMDAISDESGDSFHVGNLVGYYVAGNLLSAASMAVNMVGYPLMGSIAGLKGVTQAIAKHLGQGSNEQVLSAKASLAGAKAGMAAMGRGLSNGALAWWTGHPQAAKQANPLPNDDHDFSRSGSPIRNPFIRAAVAPFLEANRFVDEMAWTVAYNGALAAAAVERKNQGDHRTHEQIIALPEQGLIDRAVAFADWFTLRGKPESEAGKKVFNAVNTLRSPTFGGHGPRWAVNPLYFVMPFFNAIANLTIEGAKISPYGLVASAAGVAKRSYQSASSDAQDEKDTHSNKALQYLAYAMAGIGVLGMALIPGDDDDEYALTGSPRDGKSAAERSLRYAVEKPRTLNGLDVSRFDPISMPAAMHADLRDALRDIGKGKDIGPTLRDLGEKTFNAVVQRNFLSGVSDLFRSQYNEDGTPKGIVTKYTDNVAGMLAPGRPWISSYRKFTETERMSRERGGVASVYDAGTARRNVFGETEKTRDDTAASAVHGLFFTPRGEASKSAQRWQERIYDLNGMMDDAGEKTWYPSPIGRKYTLRGEEKEWSNEDYDKLQAYAGELWLDLLERNPAIKTKALSEKRELELIKDLKERANAMAKWKMYEQRE